MMLELFAAVLSNVLVASLMAGFALIVGRYWRNPAVCHALWILVLVKLVTPPLVSLPCLPGESLLAAEANEVSVPATNDPEANIRQPSHFEDDNHDPDQLAWKHWDILFNWKSDPELEPSNRREPRQDGLAEDSTAALASVGPERVERSPDTTTSPDSATAIGLRTPEFRRPESRETASPPIPLTFSWSQWFPQAIVGLLLIWLLCTIVWIARAIDRGSRFRKLIRLASFRDHHDVETIQLRVHEMARKLRLLQTPRTILVDGTLSPMIWPTTVGHILILPRTLLKTLTSEQLDSLIAHELAHLRCRHHWFRWFELAVTAVYWWCPIVWLANRRLRQYEEEICDAWVVTLLPEHTESYANLLLDTVDYLADASPRLPSTALGISHFKFLKRRITMIMRGQSKPQLSLTGWLALFAAFALVIPFSPTFAGAAPSDSMQEREEEQERGERRERRVRREQEPEGERRERRRDRDQDRDEEIEIDEEDIRELVGELTEELKGLDTEIQEAIEEVQEELQDALEDVPESVKAMLKEMDIEKIINENVKNVPEHIQKFIAEVDIESIVKQAQSGVEGNIEIDEEQLEKLEKELKSQLKSNIKSISKEITKELKDVKKEIHEGLGDLPPQVRQMLKEVDLESIIKKATSEASPVAQQFLKELNVEELISDALEQDQEKEGRRERRERDDREQEKRNQDLDKERVREREMRNRERERERDMRNREQEMLERARVRQREMQQRQREMQERSRDRVERADRVRRERREVEGRERREVEGREQRDREETEERRRPRRGNEEELRRELENRIERLMREVEEMKQQLRRLDPERSDRRTRDRADRETVERDRVERADRTERDRAERDRADRIERDRRERDPVRRDRRDRNESDESEDRRVANDANVIR